MKNIAILFGSSLDHDDFEKVKDLLAENCVYQIGSETLIGPEAILASYEQNMLAGRKKMDKLEWGTSRIETISDCEYLVHFTDYLYHRGEQYTHRCQQKLLK